MDIAQEIHEMHRSGRSAETIAQTLSKPEFTVTVDDVAAVVAKHVEVDARWALDWLKSAHGGHTPYDTAIRLIESAIQWATTEVEEFQGAPVEVAHTNGAEDAAPVVVDQNAAGAAGDTPITDTAGDQPPVLVDLVPADAPSEKKKK